MQPLILKGSKSTPSIHFDPASHVLRLQGQSYPENASKFYAPVFAWLREYLAQPEGTRVCVDVELAYFNSSSSKILMNFFEILEKTAANGTSVEVFWRYREDDETSLECGEEFKEDAPGLSFHLVPLTEE